MGDLTEIVDNLEGRVEQLLQRQVVLKQHLESLQQELTAVTAERNRLGEELERSERRNQSLKAANAMLGSKEYKKETKLRINSLIREIDQCIVQLSE